ncbi:amino acid adenylation domain-containing protein [Streptomyces sp. NPDC047821]|uniref:amino acid adenylation domain-containing protein n=1 Tax=Streptomyces sp. NPDC047821 TaxID=3365488 RepID=UPI0037113D4F
MADRQGTPTDASAAAGQDARQAVQQAVPQSVSEPGLVDHTAQLVEIRGALDLATLREAVAQVVAETTTRPVRVAGHGPGGPPTPSPGRLGAPPAPDPADGVPLPVVDLSAETDPPGAADAWTRAALRRGAERARGGEGTAQRWAAQAVLRLGPDHHHWFHQHHRAAVDRFGCALITRRVSEVYTALAEGRPATDGALTTRAEPAPAAAAYAGARPRDTDCAPSRRNASRFADLPEPVTFASAPVQPTGESRAPVNSRPVTLDATDTARVRALARSSGVPVRAVLRAAVAAYTHRLSGATDVVIGMPVDGRPTRAGRRVPDARDSIVPLRTTVRPAATFTRLVEDVARESREAAGHQRPGRREPYREAGAPDDRPRLPGPIADIRVPGPHVRFGDLSVVVHDLLPEPVHDIRVILDVDHDGAVEPADQRLRVVLSGTADRYFADELAAHARRFARLLSLMAAAPERPLGTFDLLAGDERAAVRSWTGGTAPSAPGRTLTGLLESAARNHSDAVAVISADDKLTYADLHERANRLARLLLDRGAGPESVVGLLLPRGAGTLVAMLAVLKTGAAYLPLDPRYPAERLRFMVEDARPVCVLTDSATDRHVADAVGRSTTTIRLDDPATVRDLAHLSPAPPSDADRPEPLRPAHPAYVIYTSGSTGTPKGVVVPHRGAVALVDWAAAEFGAESPAHVLAASSSSFDVSVAEIFPTLACGGSVEVVDSLLSLLDGDPPRWSGGLLYAVPSVFSQLLETGGLEVASPTLAMTGEALPATLAARIRDALPGTRLLNLYGPTEATVYATAATVHAPGATTEGEAPPIGRPMGHVRAYVLDSALHPVEAGRQGELYLAGDGLARGYLGRPGLTADRFVADPFGPPGERMYRTGDLARWRPDGQLDFLGRVDAQVKVNGFRVELGEVEAVLARHPAVTEVMVRVRKGTSGDARLVAYLVPVEGARLPGPRALRDWAAERLPAHLVPAELNAASVLPRTGSGKLDRAKPPTGVRPLEAHPPTADGAREQQEARERQRAREEQVARVFREVLGLPDGDLDADAGFFDLGGDSIMSIQVLSRLRRVGLVLTPQDIFEHKTVRALARVARETTRTKNPEPVDRTTAEGVRGAAVPEPRTTNDDHPGGGTGQGVRRTSGTGTGVLLPLRATGGEPPLFCVHAAAGLAWGYAGLTSPLGADRPLYGLQARGLDGTEALPASLREMAADYLDHVRSVQPTGPYHLLGWSFGGVVAHEMAVQLEERGEAVETLAILDAHPAGVGADGERGGDAGAVDPEASAEAAPGSVAGRDVLGLLLEFFGYDPSLWAGESLTYPRVVEITRAQEGPLGSFDEQRIAAMARVVTNNARVTALHRPRPFGGHTVMFTSREHSPETALGLWRPLLTGPLDVLPVDCTHMEMGHSAALGGVGRVLVERWASKAARKGR